jgi:CheY-like chemotaxis protein
MGSHWPCFGQPYEKPRKQQKRGIIVMKDRPEILIVDDFPDNLRILASILEQEGYGVRVATNGPQAILNAKTLPPQLVLLDIRLPSMDGYEVCRILKADPVLRNIPVIFISGLASPDHRIRAFREGGVDYITKPFRVEEVLAKVHSHCRPDPQWAQ